MFPDPAALASPAEDRNQPRPGGAPSRRDCLLALLGAPWAATAGAAARRDEAPLQLASEALGDIDPRGWFVSEKFDGARAWWDGRTLRFRSGIVIHAPAWFTSGLPAAPLDGELWLGRGCFEELSGIVRRREPDEAAWRKVVYLAFDLPGAPGPFAQRAQQLQRIVGQAALQGLVAVEQAEVASRAELVRRLEAVVVAGGEGLMLHRADAAWRRGRSPHLLKLKPLQDGEAVVIGHQPGRGRLEGLVGALRVRDEEGREFLLGTGLGDAQRRHPPGVGTVVTYTYQGRTGGGLPRFASFLRVRDEL